VCGLFRTPHNAFRVCMCVSMSAATDAGLCAEPTDLSLVLEPEAASILCRSQPEVRSDPTFRPGVRYMILDCGGGTVDITVHQLVAGDRVEELIAPDGGPWGSTYIDREFKKLLSQALDPNFREEVEEQWLFSSYEKAFPGDAVTIMKKFEAAKQSMNVYPDPVVQAQQTATIALPSSLARHCRNVLVNSDGNISLLLEQASRRGVYDKAVQLAPDAQGRVLPVPMSVDEEDDLTLSFGLIQSLVQPFIERIVAKGQEILRRPAASNVSHIFLVGGFATSDHLHQAIIRAFPRLTVIRPAAAGLSVVKGAVFNGLNAGAIKSRISAYTYGMGVMQPWIESVHGTVGITFTHLHERRDEGRTEQLVTSFLLFSLLSLSSVAIVARLSKMASRGVETSCWHSSVPARRWSITKWCRSLWIRSLRIPLQPLFNSIDLATRTVHTLMIPAASSWER
jgi:hypothetical protein